MCKHVGFGWKGSPNDLLNPPGGERTEYLDKRLRKRKMDSKIICNLRPPQTRIQKTPSFFSFYELVRVQHRFESITSDLDEEVSLRLGEEAPLANDCFSDDRASAVDIGGTCGQTSSPTQPRRRSIWSTLDILHLLTVKTLV